MPKPVREYFLNEKKKKEAKTTTATTTRNTSPPNQPACLKHTLANNKVN